MPMTNADIIRIVKKWQSAGHVHELTCRIDSRHEALVPIEREGKVNLGCPTCGTAQELIPEFVLSAEAELDRLSAHLASQLEAQLERHRRVSRILWSFASATLGAGLLTGLLLGPAWALVGIAAGAAVAYAANREAFRRR